MTNQKKPRPKNGKKRKVNLFDLVIVLVVVVLGAGLYVLTHRENVMETKKLLYTIELNDLPVGLTENIRPGDKLTDGVKNYNMGIVVSAEKTDNLKLAEDYTTGRIAESAVPNTERAVIVVEGDVTESASDFRVDGSFLVKAGLQIDVHGPGYAGSGYIISVERGEE